MNEKMIKEFGIGLEVNAARIAGARMLLNVLKDKFKVLLNFGFSGQKRAYSDAFVDLLLRDTLNMDLFMMESYDRVKFIPQDKGYRAVFIDKEGKEISR